MRYARKQIHKKLNQIQTYIGKQHLKYLLSTKIRVMSYIELTLFYTGGVM